MATVDISENIGMENKENELKTATSNNNGQNDKDATANLYYKICELKPFGAEINGIDLNECNLNDNKLIETIRSDIHKHELIVFRNQGIKNNNTLKPEKHLEIGKKLGNIVSSHYNHPASPHRDIFCVSNDENFGCLNVGRTGWHIDGTFLEKPYSYSLMHIIKVPEKGFGQTAFLSSNQMIDSLLLSNNSNNDNDKKNSTKDSCDNESLYSLLSRLYMVGLPPTYPIHPVIYKHPITKKDTMIIHLGMVKTFMEVKKGYENKIDFAKMDLETILQKYNNNDENENDNIVTFYDKIQTQSVLKAVSMFIEQCKKQGLMYKHDYQSGDLLISDNLAVLHEATPSTQDSIEKIGLRVMHRVSVGGKHTLSKF